jgi:membrane protein implicated in regulation of membrane protease activity
LAAGLRGGLPATTGFAFALVTILYRADIVGRLFSPQATGYKSASDFVGTIGEAVEDIPAGGHGQITFHDHNARLVAVMAASDVNVARGTAVRIVGTRGLNPLIVPEPGAAAPTR